MRIREIFFEEQGNLIYRSTVPDRKAERPASHLDGFKGILQVDGYAGVERLTAGGDIVLAGRWAIPSHGPSWRRCDKPSQSH
jgi:Transposase IS66 family